MPATKSRARIGAIVLLFVAASSLAAASDLDNGIAAFNAGRYSVALSELKRALAADPSSAEAQVFLALTQAAQSDCQRALPVLRANADTADAKLARLAGLAACKCEEAAGNNTAALAILETLERRFPNDADVLYALAKLNMKAFNDITLLMYQRAASSYRVHELSAEIFEVQSRYDEAVDEYKKAIAINPAAPDLHFRLGRALLMRSHNPDSLDQAAEAFTAELKVSPEDAASEFQLGQIAQVQNRNPVARAHFERAISLSPAFPEALVALAKLDAQEKQYSSAIPLLKRALNVQPANESAHYALMMAYRDSGQTEKAKAEKAELDRLQKPPEGEFTQFLKKLGEKPAPQ